MEDIIARLSDRFTVFLASSRRKGFFGRGELPQPLAMLLLWISNHPEMGVVDIAHGMNVAPPTVTVALHGLVGKGLVRKEKSPTDGRAKIIVLTDKGEEIATKLKEKRIKYLRAFMSGLTNEEQEMFFSLLEKMLDNFEKTMETLDQELMNE